MKVQLHATPEAFTELAPEWNRLLDPARSDTLFLTLDWQRVWWKHLGRGDLMIFSLREDDGTLRGIAPLFLEEDNGERLLRLVGSHEVVDYLDMLIAPGHEDAVCHALLDHLLAWSPAPWDCIDLQNIPEYSPTRAAIHRIVASRLLPLTVTERRQEVCPIITLPGDYEHYLEELDKKQRHELRRKRRKAEGVGVEWYRTGPEHPIEAESADFLRLMELSTDAKAQFLTMPGHLDFLREMATVQAEAGHLEILFLLVEGQKVASLFQFAYGDRILLYNSGIDVSQYSSLSTGIVLLTYGIEDAIQRGYRYYDFLRGDEIYKFRMGAQETHIYNLSLRR
ncbi:MAG: GNAT family N-acetyltransferase [Anaerolineae bacterium]|nr:GNAT family N-acetyltransferase [Anaerolineae bacterium]